MITLYPSARTIMETLIDAGYEAYIVGGYVRDQLLKRRSADIDIVTSASSAEISGLYPDAIRVGMSHETLVVRQHGLMFEVSSFKTRKTPESAPSSLEVDLSLRDFTMNAIAMPPYGALIDPYLGARDIMNRRICTVGRAKERFKEDPLRLLRALRFASQLSFQIEEKTEEAIATYASLLETGVAIERIVAEFEKLLQGPAHRQALGWLLETGLALSIPFLKDNQAALRRLLAIDLSRLTTTSERWACLVVVFGIEDPKHWLKQCKRSKQVIREVCRLVDVFQARIEHGWSPLLFYQAGMACAMSVERLVYVLGFHAKTIPMELVKQNIVHLPIQNRSELAINGDDLVALMERKPGAWVSVLLNEIEKAVVAKEVENDKAKISVWLKKEGLG